MRILHICAYTWAIGGPAKMIYDHTSVHAAQGEQITILTPVSDDDVIYDTAPGVRVIPVKRHWFSRFFPEFSPALYQYLREHGNAYDLIHVHGLWHFGSIAPYLLNLRPPKVMTIHGLLDQWAIRHGYWKKRLMTWLVQKKNVEKTQLIHINNTSEKQDLQNYLGYQRSNVVIIPNGLRPADFRNLPPKGAFRQRFGIAADQRVILFLSRINVKKGLDLLLPAFERLLQTHPNTVLALVGPDDGYKSEVEQFVQEHDLKNRVILTGLLTGEDKLTAFADADVFALPTYSESFAIAALEAMASGVPALLTEHVGFGDYIRSYQSAQLCETTVDSVHNGLTYLLDHPAEAATMARNARRMIDEVCDIHVLANQLLDAYYQLLPQKV